MLTQKPAAGMNAEDRPAAPARPLDDLVCYFEGRHVAVRDATVSIMTHAFMYGTAVFEGIRAYKASQGVADYDVNAMATRQEMRSFVCGQCHVEYYFKGPEKRLTYPWSKGLRVEQIQAYYDEVGWNDWKHAQSGAGVRKLPRQSRQAKASEHVFGRLRGFAQRQTGAGDGEQRAPAARDSVAGLREAVPDVRGRGHGCSVRAPLHLGRMQP